MKKSWKKMLGIMLTMVLTMSMAVPQSAMAASRSLIVETEIIPENPTGYIPKPVYMEEGVTITPINNTGAFMEGVMGTPVIAFDNHLDLHLAFDAPVVEESLGIMAMSGSGVDVTDAVCIERVHTVEEGLIDEAILAIELPEKMRPGDPIALNLGFEMLFEEGLELVRTGVTFMLVPFGNMEAENDFSDMVYSYDPDFEEVISEGEIEVWPDMNIFVTSPTTFGIKSFDYANPFTVFGVDSETSERITLSPEDVYERYFEIQPMMDQDGVVFGYEIIIREMCEEYTNLLLEPNMQLFNGRKGFHGVPINFTYTYAREEIDRISIVLSGGDIGLYTQMTLDQDALDEEEYTLTYTMNGVTEELLLAGDQAFIPVPPAEMTTDITFNLYRNGELLDSPDAVSFEDCALALIEDCENGGKYQVEVVDLAKALLNYGARAQEYFGIHADKPADANVDVDGYGYDLSELLKEAEVASNQNEAGLIKDTLDEMDYVGTSLVCLDELVLRTYLVTEKPITSEQVREMLRKGNTYPDEVKVNGNIITLDYFVRYANILDDVKYINVMGEDGNIYLVSSVSDYAYKASQTNDSKLMKLLEAMYSVNFYANELGWEEEVE